MDEPINILSIDGGGIRGIIPATILIEIERRTDKPISELFNLFAGTSTGALLVLGLNKPKPDLKPEFSAQDMLDFYMTNGPHIFYRSLWQTISSIGGLVEEKYSESGLKSILEEKFSSTRLKDSINTIVIPTYEIERSMPFFFRSKRAEEDDNYDFFMKDVARCATAAPTYFEPSRLNANDEKEYFSLIDGGVFANNPSLCIYAESRNLFPKNNNILLLSLGTGQLTKRLHYDKAKGYGLANWARPVLDIVFDGVSDSVDYQLDRVLPSIEGQQRYHRFQVSLPVGTNALDNTKQENLRSLTLLGEDLIRERSHEIDLLCENLLVRSKHFAHLN